MASLGEAVNIQITGQDLLSGPADAAGQSLGRLESTASRVGTVLGGVLLAGAAGAAGAFAGVVTAAAGFEKTMSGVSAVTGATAEQMAGLGAAALKIGKETSFSASEAAKGIEELAKAGVSIPDIMGGAARSVADLAAAGSVGLKEAAEIASNAMNVFGKSGSDMAGVANTIAGAANASAIDVKDFKFSLASAGAVAATVGFSFEDLSTAIAVMGQAGIKGSDAGTSLKTMMLSLIPSTNKQKDLFRELGLETFNVEQGLAGLRAKGINPASSDLAGLSTAMYDHLGLSQDIATWTNKDRQAYEEFGRSIGLVGSAFFDSTGKVKSMAEVAEVLQTATEGMTEAQKLATLEVIFGSDAIRAGAVFAKSGAEGFDAMAGAMGKVTAEQVGLERLNNLSGSLEQLKGSVETAAISIGLAFTPALKGIVDGVTTLVNGAMPALEGFAAGASAAIVEAGRQIGDAWRTVQQVFGEGWEPSEAVDPFVNAVGRVATIVRDAVGAIVGLPVPLKAAAGAFAAVMVGAGPLSAILGTLPGIFAALAAPIAAFASPLGLVALGVAALAAAWTANLGGIQEKTATVFGIVQPLFEQFGQIVTRVLSGDLAGAFAQFTGLLTTTGAQLAPLLATWGAEFVAWLTATIPPMLAEATRLGSDLLAWVGAQVPTWTAAFLAWGTEWVNWLTVAGPPLLAAAVAYFEPLVAWVAAQVPVLVSALLAWGTEFVAWVAPMIPPLLTALATVAAGVTAWIAEQIPGLVATLATWGAEFVAWVAPQIPPLLTALGGLLGQIVTWATGTALPAIVAEMVKWGAEFVAWIGPATQEALTAFGVMLGQFTVWLASDGLPAIRTGLVEWRLAMSQWITDSGPDVLTALGGLILIILDEFRKLPAQVLALGMESGRSIVDGMISGADGDKGKLMEALKAIIVSALGMAWNGAKVMIPGLGAISGMLPGGGASAQTLSYRPGGGAAGGGSTANMSPGEYVRWSAKQRGMTDPESDDLASVVMGESSNSPDWNTVGSFPTGTSYGPLQLHYKGGPDPKAGMGDAFTEETGIDLRKDRSIEANQAAVDFAINKAIEGGTYQPWYGADKPLGQDRERGIYAPVSPSGGARPLPIGAGRDATGASPNTQPAVDQAGGVRGGVPGLTQVGLPVGNQFEMGLPYSDAIAACGVAAVEIFRQMTGRTPNAQEAMAIARRNGWTADAGMNSNQIMGTLGDLGIQAAIDNTPTQGEAAGAIRGGNAVSLSSGATGSGPLPGGHHFVASGYDDASGKFDLGETGGPDPTGQVGSTALKSGSRFMSWKEIENLAGPINTVITLLDQIPGRAMAASGSFTDLAGSVTAMGGETTAGATATQWLAEQFQAGALTAEQFATGMVGVAINTGALLPEFVGAGSAALDMDTGFNALLQTLGATDPQFAALAASVRATGEVTPATLEAFAALLTGVQTTATGVTEQSAAMATNVQANTDLMASGALTSVTSLGDGMLTTLQAASGTSIATVTDMNGQITSQYATLSSGAQLEFGNMAAGMLTSVTDLGSGTMTTVQDMAGNTLTTITDLSGNVVNQYTSMAGDATAQAQAMGSDTAAAAVQMATDIIAQAAAMASGAVASGAEMASGVVGSFGEVGGAAESLAEPLDGLVGTLGEVGGAAGEAAEPVGEFGSVLGEIEVPDLGDIVSQLEDVTEAAEEAKEAIEDIPDAPRGKGKRKGRDGDDDDDEGGDDDEERHSGGDVQAGQNYIIGRTGAEEMFRPNVSGHVYSPSIRPAPGGGGADIDYERLAAAISRASREQNLNLTINTTAPHEPIVQDFQTLMALAGQ